MAVSLKLVIFSCICQLCSKRFKQPRVLSCLHVYCTPCLEKEINVINGEGTEEKAEPKVKDSIICTMCKQETKVPKNGIEELPLDTVMSNILEMSAIEEMAIVCTSCKAREKAVARCNDCVSFLCPNCVTAHQYMRCFENHKVLQHFTI